MKPNIEIEHPICFLKAKGTSEDPYNARITELSVVKYEKDKEPLAFTIKYSVEGGDKSTFVFETKAKGLNNFFKDCGFVGYNIRSFDLILLVQEFNRAGETFSFYNRKIVDLCTMYNKLNPSTFESAYEQYVGVKIGGEIPLNDIVYNSVELFNAMISKHEKLGNDVNKLSKWFNPNFNALDCKGLVILNVDNKPVFNFGPHKGKTISEICLNDPEYFKLVTVSDIPKDTIQVIKSIVAKAAKHKQVQQ